MTATEILREARRRGVELQIEGRDQIRYRAPAGALEDGLLDEIRRNKPDLLQALRCHPCSTCGKFAFSEPRVCYWCRLTATMSVTA